MIQALGVQNTKIPHESLKLPSKGSAYKCPEEDGDETMPLAEDTLQWVDVGSSKALLQGPCWGDHRR